MRYLLTYALLRIIIPLGCIVHALKIEEGIIKNTITKVFFGSVVILRGYCKKCKQTALVVDGRHMCCGEPVKEIFEKERKKREIEGENRRSHISKKIKEKILQQQENRCIYCEKELAEYIWNEKREKYVKLKLHFDHFISWNYSRDNCKDNLYASCHICNQIKSDKYFYDVISAKEFIQHERTKKGY